jgi:hypothetical protein
MIFSREEKEKEKKERQKEKKEKKQFLAVCGEHFVFVL